MKHSVIAVGYDWPLEIRNKDRLRATKRRGARGPGRKSFKRQLKGIESPGGMKKPRRRVGKFLSSDTRAREDTA